jgi:pimeloyl-ACP methyl ester carboxylesterase
MARAHGTWRLQFQPLHWLQTLAIAVGCLALCAFDSTDVPHMQMRIAGHGARTVVLAAGLGDTLDIWNTVQPLITEHCTRTIAYSRAGYPGSDVASRVRDAETIVGELRAELKRRGIQPPYVLVGHSLGGLYMQYFARQFPQEVSGLVLIDSTHWNQQLQLGLQGAGGADGPPRLVVYSMPWIVRRELNDSAVAGEQVHDSPPAGNLPTIVLSRTRTLHGESEASRLQAIHLQDDIAASFPNARHLNVDASGHYIQRDRPEVVIDAARELAGCAPLLAKR